MYKSDRGFKVVGILILCCCFLSGGVSPKGNQNPIQIDLWFGSRQSFGQLGNTQRQINILGNVRGLDEGCRLGYLLNQSGKEVELTIGSDLHRLAGEGDFNIDIDRSLLLEGSNQVVLSVKREDELLHAEEFTFNYVPGKKWVLPYHVEWSKADKLQDVVEIVDGKWEITRSGVRVMEMYYDRILAIGDSSWSDYEVESSVRFHDYIPPANGPPTYNVAHVAIASRWPGHDRDSLQPDRKWFPLGATSEFRITDNYDSCRWRIFDGENFYAEQEVGEYRTIQPEKLYGIKHRVENISDSKVRYSVKFWDAEKEEPPGWDFHAIELNSRKERGSACLIAHNTEVTFGDIHVRPVENSLPLEDIKPRLLITTDIGGDPDDTQSLIRLLVTSSEFDLEGIITSASGTPGELDTFVVRPDLVLDLIDSYDSVYENLSIHHSGFPEPTYLRGIVKCGNFMRGLDYIGEGRDTEGSRWIEERILAEDDRPLNICIWGGQTDLFQALFSLKNSLSLNDFKDVTSRIRIYNISDQDRIHQHFKSAFPELFHILAKSPPGMDKREGTYRGMYLGGDESLTSRDWIYTHVKEGHGPLGALYPDRTWTAPNRHACLKEGDTPSWFYFLNNGLQEPDKPGWGGWGGRFRVSTAAYFRDAHDCIDTICSARASVWRWRKAFQNDFAARMDWCVHSYEEANHHPVAEVNGDRTRKILCYSLKDKDEIWLDAGGSFDPDNQPLDFRWWIYAEPSGLERPPEIKHGNAACIKVDPEWLGEREKIHLVLEVSDRGNPSLTSYRRILVTSYRKCIFGRAQ